MKTTRIITLGVSCLALAMSGAACAKRNKPVTDRDRKEAVLLASEAQFAAGSLRDWARAEGLLSKAAELTREPEYCMALASARLRLNNRSGAKEAYEQARRGFEDAAARDATKVEPWLSQVTVLVLLGRIDDGRAVLNKAAKRFPNDSRIKALQEPKNFEQMLNDPKLKENAL